MVSIVFEKLVLVGGQPEEVTWFLDPFDGRTLRRELLTALTVDKFGLVVYRAQELSTEGTRLLDKSLVVRFPLGKAGEAEKK